jgi:chemotaxis protein CheD
LSSAAGLVAAASPFADRTAKIAYLHPGQLVACSGAAVMTTVLGSCVSVCLYDEQAEAGGINHFVLPEGLASDRDSPRYALPACERLLERVLALGARRERLAAKLFGGASALLRPLGRPSVGDSNVLAARRWLEQQHIEILAAETGGEFGRRLAFELPSGSAWVRLLKGGAR